MWLRLPWMSPTANSENPAPCSVSHSASAPASFIGS